MNMLGKYFARGKGALVKDADASETNGKKVTNPYLNARRSWNGYGMSLMSMNQFLIAGILVCLLIAAGAVGGVIKIGSQSKIIPMVFEQDAAANLVSITKLERVPDATLRNYQQAVINFVINVRSVTPDITVQRKRTIGAYAYLAPQDPATEKTNVYLNGSPERHPYKRAETETVDVEIKGALPISKDSWQVDWLETVRARDGKLKEPPFMMRVIISTYQNTEAEANENSLTNPHAIFMRDYNWSKQF